jgi:hypothetical protein
MKPFLALGLSFLLGLRALPLLAVEEKSASDKPTAEKPVAEKPATKEAAAILDLLQQKDFWTNAGKLNGRKWSPEEEQQLHKTWAAARDPVVRVRANKILVDLANQGKSDGDEDFVAANFQRLEEKLQEPSVKILCADTGFTHYFSNRGQKGVFLIEHVTAMNPASGGLNLYWDEAQKKLEKMKAWGFARVAEQN